MVLNIKFVDEILSMTIQMKAEQYFPVVLVIILRKAVVI